MTKPDGDDIKDDVKDDDVKDDDVKDDKLDDKDKDDKKEGDDELIPRSMLEDAIKSRQAAKNKLRETMKKLEELSPYKEQAEDLKEKLEEYSKLKKEMDSIRKEKEAKELETKTEAEKEAIKARKELESLREEFQSKIDEAMKGVEKKDEVINSLSGEVENLRSFKLEREILSAANKHKAINPNQIVRLLRGDFEYDKTDDSYYHNVKTKTGSLKDQVDVETYVKNFLEDDENSNLVSAGMRSGTGQSDSYGDRGAGKKGQIKSTSEMYKTKEDLEKALKLWAKDRDYIWEEDKDRAVVIKFFEKHGDKMFKM